MPTDALLQLQASTTKTATFSGTALTLASGTPRRGLKARVIYSAASTSSGAGSVTLGLEASYDAGSTWGVVSEVPAIVLSATAASGETFLPFEISPTSVVNGCQIRLAIEAISGTGATITYQGDLTLSRP